MRIFYDNRIDYVASSAVTQTSYSGTLPGYNVQDDLKTKVWRTGTSTAAESITFDLGSAQGITSMIIFAHTLLSGDSNIKVRASTDNFAASDVAIATCTWASGPIVTTFNSATYRYWRLQFTKATAGSSRDIGRIFLGTYYDCTDSPDYSGVQVDRTDLTNLAKSAGGQTYADTRPSFRTYKIPFSQIAQSQWDTFVLMASACGEFKNLFFQVDTGSTGDISECIYGRLKGMIGGKVEGVDSTLLYTVKMEIEEQL